MANEPQFWRRCSSCKKEITFGQIYWVCNVSTCNRKRTGTVFCTVSCWEAHVPIMRHRESWAEERRSPTQQSWQKEQAAAAAPAATSRPAKRTLVRPSASGGAAPAAGSAQAQELPRDILIVTSKLKQYIRAASGMNTSDPVMAKLSEHVRALCDQAIREARRSERKTVMDRDFPDP